MTSSSKPRVRQLTIRHSSAQLDRGLKKLARARGESVNSLVLSLLEDATRVDEQREWLQSFARWSKEEADAFDAALREQRQVDDDLWR
jgi:hypothetical protein